MTEAGDAGSPGGAPRRRRAALVAGIALLVLWPFAQAFFFLAAVLYRVDSGGGTAWTTAGFLLIGVSPLVVGLILLVGRGRAISLLLAGGLAVGVVAAGAAWYGVHNRQAAIPECPASVSDVIEGLAQEVGVSPADTGISAYDDGRCLASWEVPTAPGAPDRMARWLTAQGYRVQTNDEAGTGMTDLLATARDGSRVQVVVSSDDRGMDLVTVEAG